MSRTSSLSATNLATYHHFSCDLYIHNVYHDGKAVGSGVRASSEEPSELSKAQFQRGVDWEQTLLSWLDESGLLLTVPSTPMDPSYFIENLIMDDRPYFFVAGLVFWPPSQELNARYRSNGKTPVNFGLAKPDLLEVTKTPTGFIWRVVDAKASSHVKVCLILLILRRKLINALDFTPRSDLLLHSMSRLPSSRQCLRTVENSRSLASTRRRI